MSASSGAAFIVLAAMVTYLTRAGGIWAMKQIPFDGRTELLLEYASYSAIAALLANSLAVADVELLFGCMAAAAVMHFWGRPVIAMFFAMAVTAFMRSVGSLHIQVY